MQNEPRKDVEHIIKTTHVETDKDVVEYEASKEEENQRKVEQFNWDEIEDEGGQPLKVMESDIHDGATTIMAYVLKRLSGEHFVGVDEAGMSFVMPIDLDLHPLIKLRFEDQWNLDDRLSMFDSLREAVLALFDDPDKRSLLNGKIEEALPPGNRRKKFTSGAVSLEDDAMVVDDSSDMVSVEIPVHFAANI